MIDLILAVKGRDGTQLAKHLIEHMSGLTVTAVTDCNPIPDKEVVENGDCVVAILSEDAAEPLPLYALFRESYPDTPLVLMTDIDDPALIQRVLDDESGDYVYLPTAEIPFGLLSVRCKRLVEDST